MDQQKKILKISIKLYSLNFYKKVEMSKVQFEEYYLYIVLLWLTSLKFHFITSMLLFVIEGTIFKLFSVLSFIFLKIVLFYVLYF